MFYKCLEIVLFQTTQPDYNIKHIVWFALQTSMEKMITDDKETVHTYHVVVCFCTVYKIRSNSYFCMLLLSIDIETASKKRIQTLSLWQRCKGKRNWRLPRRIEKQTPKQIQHRNINYSKKSGKKRTHKHKSPKIYKTTFFKVDVKLQSLMVWDQDGVWRIEHKETNN